MQRKEALTLVGQSVRAWTAMNGEYVGILEGIQGVPWRGTVRITGILAVAQHLQNGQPCRRGFRVGETIEVGHSSISQADAPGSPDYLQMLLTTQEYWRARAQVPDTSKYAWLPPAWVQALDVVIAAERQRLAGQPWDLRRLR